MPIFVMLWMEENIFFETGFLGRKTVMGVIRRIFVPCCEYNPKRHESQGSSSSKVYRLGSHPLAPQPRMYGPGRSCISIPISSQYIRGFLCTTVWITTAVFQMREECGPDRHMWKRKHLMSGLQRWWIEGDSWARTSDVLCG
jgi:hypothetical protein